MLAVDQQAKQHVHLHTLVLLLLLPQVTVT
jgi:hypothetical protein